MLLIIKLKVRDILFNYNYTTTFFIKGNIGNICHNFAIADEITGK